MAKNRLLLLMVASAVLFSCNSGGGEESTSGGGEVLKRGKKTGIRLIHAVIDEPPLSIEIDASLTQSARYGETRYYQGVKPGERLVRVFRKNSPLEVIGEVPVNFQTDTEYTLFVSGSSGSVRNEVVIDQTQTPPKGRANLRFFNGYGERLRLVSPSGETSTVGKGEASSAVEIGSGAQQLAVFNDRGEALITQSVTVPDQGDVAMVLIGEPRLGVRYLRQYDDLD